MTILDHPFAQADADRIRGTGGASGNWRVFSVDGH